MRDELILGIRAYDAGCRIRIPSNRNCGGTMRRLYGGLIVVACLLAAVGCVTVVSAPGADQVRLTEIPAEVTGCTPMGNIQPLPNMPASSARIMFRNRVIGFGGNTGLITRYIFAEPIEGIAYRCPAGTRTAAK